MKDGSIRIVLQLQTMGRDKPSLRDLIGAAVEIRQGVRTDTFYLNNKTALVSQLRLGKAVEFDTGITSRSRLANVRIKGHRDFLTLKNMDFKDLSPLEVPKKSIGIGNISPLEVPPKAWKFPKTAFWDIYVDSIEVETWMPNWKYKYNDRYPENEAIHVSARPYNYPNAAMWVKIVVHVKVKSIPKAAVTKIDVLKWGQGIEFKAEFNVENFQGSSGGKDGYNSTVPAFTWEAVQTWPEDGYTWSLPKLRTKLVYELSHIDSMLEDPRLNHNGTLRLPVKVDLDWYANVKETNELNNTTHLPILVFSKKFFPIKLLRPAGQIWEKWIIGSSEEIQWEANSISSKMKILLYDSRDWPAPPRLVGVIADDILPPPPVSGTTTHQYNWHVGHLLGGKVAEPGNMYWIKINSEPEGTAGVQPVMNKDFITLLKVKGFVGEDILKKDDGEAKKIKS